MNRWMGLIVFLAVCLAFEGVLLAEEVRGGDGFQVRLRVRAEYDDNVYETETDETDSVNLITELELHGNAELEQTFLSLRYRPSFIYWSDREPDGEDMNHDLDLILNHEFSPRSRLGLQNTFQYSDRPELMDRGVVIQENGKYTYNVTDGNLEHFVLPSTYARVGGRYSVLRYSEDDVAALEDHDIFSVGLTLGQEISGGTSAGLDYRFEDTSYDGPDRGAESHYVGVAAEHNLSASMIGSLRAGVQSKSFDAAGIEDADDPYVDASLTYLVSPDTRITVGGGFSMFEADVYPFVNQDRTVLFATFGHDLTAKISLYLAGSYQLSEYDLSQLLVSPAETVQLPQDTDENVLQGSARVSYELSRNNWLEAGYQHISLDSDLRGDFDRNRLSLGWRTQL